MGVVKPGQATPPALHSARPPVADFRPAARTGDRRAVRPPYGGECNGAELCGALAGDGFAEPFEQAFELGHALAQIGLPLLEAPETFLDALVHPVDTSVEPRTLPEDETGERHADGEDRDELGGR